MSTMRVDRNLRAERIKGKGACRAQETGSNGSRQGAAHAAPRAV